MKQQPPDPCKRPKAGMTAPRKALFDDLIRALQERRRDRQAERLGGLEVDHEVELRRLLDRQIARPGAPKDLVNVPGEATQHVGIINRVGHQSANVDERGLRIHGRQTILRDELHELPTVAPEQNILDQQEGTYPGCCRRKQSTLEVPGIRYRKLVKLDTQCRRDLAEPLHHADPYGIVGIPHDGDSRDRWDGLPEELKFLALQLI